MKKFICIKYKLGNFFDIWPKAPSSHNKNERNERLFDTMLFKLMKNEKRFFFMRLTLVLH